MITRKPALTVVLITALIGKTTAEGKEVQLSEVPAPVKVTIDQKTAGGAIEEIEVEEENGRQIYEVEFKRDGKEVEIKIAADGSYLGEDTDDNDDKTSTTGARAADDKQHTIDMASAPEPVRTALTSLLSGATLQKLTKETQDDQVVYEAKYEVDGKRRSAELTAAGTIVELEEPVPVEELPGAVRSAAKRLHPAGMIMKAESVVKTPGAGETRYFALEVLSKEETHNLDVDPTGKVLESDDDNN